MIENEVRTPSRRDFLKIPIRAVVTFLIYSLFGAACEGKETTDDLIKEIKKIEASYQKEDLRDVETRERHLSLVAEFFSLTSGEKVDKDELINSVVFLDGEEFKRRVYPDAITSQIDYSARKVFINQDSEVFRQEYTQAIRRMIPNWSALSSVRMNYFEEFFRYRVKPRRPEFELTSEWEGKRITFREFQGFLMVFDIDGSEKIDDYFESSFLLYLSRELQKKFDYQEFQQFEKADLTFGIGVVRFSRLFSLKPEWHEVFKDFYRDSDLLGLARFLADQAGLKEADDLSKLKYGMGMIFGFDEEADSSFEEFLEKIQSKDKN